MLYQALGRAPDLAGLSYWAGSGLSLMDIATSMLHSAEAQTLTAKSRAQVAELRNELRRLRTQLGEQP